MIVSKFKNSDAPIRLSVIDTAALFRNDKRIIDGNKAHGGFDRGVKSAFTRCFRLFHGSVISFQAFDADFTPRFFFGDKAQPDRRLQFSVATSSILKTYQGVEQKRGGSMEKNAKDRICKLRLCQPSTTQVRYLFTLMKWFCSKLRVELELYLVVGLLVNSLFTHCNYFFRTWNLNYFLIHYKVPQEAVMPFELNQLRMITFLEEH